MSVLFEYFRAPDRDTALRLLGMAGGDGEPTAPTSTTADALGAPGVDSTVTLGQLMALVREVPWDADLVRGDLVWPVEEPDAGEAATEDVEELPDDSPWTSGVTVEELDDELRDDLAGVHDAELPALTEQWARIEEFGEEPDLETVGALLAQLVGLARRARDDGDRLYSWCSV